MVAVRCRLPELAVTVTDEGMGVEPCVPDCWLEDEPPHPVSMKIPAVTQRTVRAERNLRRPARSPRRQQARMAVPLTGKRSAAV
jgi:hypothetical protein